MDAPFGRVPRLKREEQRQRVAEKCSGGPARNLELEAKDSRKEQLVKRMSTECVFILVI